MTRTNPFYKLGIPQIMIGKSRGMGDIYNI